MTVGELTVDLKMNAEPFKKAMAEVNAAIEELEAALARLRTTGIEISVEGAKPTTRPPPPEDSNGLIRQGL